MALTNLVHSIEKQGQAQEDSRAPLASKDKGLHWMEVGGLRWQRAVGEMQSTVVPTLDFTE